MIRLRQQCRMLKVTRSVCLAHQRALSLRSEPETNWQERYASYLMIAMETEPLDTSWKSKTRKTCYKNNYE